MLCYNALYADDIVASQRALHMAGPPNKQKGATATMERVKIVKLVDYREIPVPEKMLEVKVPGSLIDKELARAAKQHATITPRVPLHTDTVTQLTPSRVGWLWGALKI